MADLCQKAANPHHRMREINEVNEDDLIDAIYELALNVREFDDFIFTWEAFLEQQNSTTTSKNNISRVLIRHFERAFEAMQRSTAGGSQQDSKATLHLPVVEINKHGGIVRTNHLAERYTGKSAKLQEAVAQDYRKTLAGAIDKAETNKIVCPTLIEFTGLGRHLIMVYPNDQDENTLLANILSLELRDSQLEKLAQLYKLSTRETEIAQLLYQGLSIRDIAEQQNKALETVRKQAKSILAKTGTSSQAHLMRIMASASLSGAESASTNWEHSRHGIRTIRLRDGRNLSYYDSVKGDKGTVVVLHGIVHDPELPEEVDHFLNRQGYRVIGVVRAWFGQSSPAPKQSKLFETALLDLGELVNQLELSNITLIGIQAGSLHALQFASAHPNKVEQIIAISGMVPIRSETQLQALPIGLRAVAKSARILPSVLPTLVSGGLSLIYKKDFKRIFNIVYRNSPVDLQATTNSTVFERLARGFNFALHNGYNAYVVEGMEIMSDMSENIKDLYCPVTFINGELDGLTDIETVQQFCDNTPGAQLIRMPKLGNLYLYSSPQLLVRALHMALSSIDQAQITQHANG